MLHETEREYHVRRARAELDLAYRSDCPAAMEAHLRLSSLHMRKVRDGEPAGPPFAALALEPA